MRLLHVMSREEDAGERLPRTRAPFRCRHHWLPQRERPHLGLAFASPAPSLDNSSTVCSPSTRESVVAGGCRQDVTGRDAGGGTQAEGGKTVCSIPTACEVNTLPHASDGVSRRIACSSSRLVARMLYFASQKTVSRKDSLSGPRKRYMTRVS